MDVFYNSFGSGGRGPIKSLIHYEEHPADTKHSLFGEKDETGSQFSTDTNTTARFNQTVYSMHPVQLPPLVRLDFPLALFNYFHLCTNLWLYPLASFHILNSNNTSLIKHFITVHSVLNLFGYCLGFNFNYEALLLSLIFSVLLYFLWCVSLKKLSTKKLRRQ